MVRGVSEALFASAPTSGTTRALMRTPFVRSVSVVLALVAGCGGSTTVAPLAGDAGARDVSTDAAGRPDVAPSTGTDLPCEVRNMLTHDCITCHSDPPRADGAFPMLTLEQLRAPSASDPSMSVAQRAAIRMRDATSPMPPGGNEPETAIAAFEAWVNSGAPGSSCDSPAPDPFAAAVACTTGTRWNSGNRGSTSMNPGQACISCHTTMRRGPFLSLAGTLYSSGHETNNCYGVAATAANVRAVVEVTDANGTVVRMAPNGVGNFYSQTRITPPYTARVIVGDLVRQMNTPQTDGDCNTCHTQDGAMAAPGRIVLP